MSETVAGVTTQYLVDTQNPTGYAQVVDEIQNGAVTKTYSYGLERISQNWQPTTGNWAGGRAFLAFSVSNSIVGCPVLAFAARAGTTNHCTETLNSPKFLDVRVSGSHPLKTAKGGGTLIYGGVEKNLKGWPPAFETEE